MKKINWFLVGGIGYLIYFVINLIESLGEIRPAFTIDWSMVFGAIVINMIPFVFGWLSGRWHKKGS